MKTTRIILAVILLITGIALASIPRSNRTWVRVGALQTPFDTWGAERGHDANLARYVWACYGPPGMIKPIIL